MRFIVDIGSNYCVGDSRPNKARAIKLIEQASKSGATAVKFQLFDTLYRDKKTQKNIQKIALPREWISELSEACAENGVTFLCTPFSLEALDFILPYINEVKIASWDITYKPLIQAIGKTRLPVIMSTGGATVKEIKDAVGWIYGESRENVSEASRVKNYYIRDHLTLMHCTGGYPTPPQNMQLNKILEIGTVLGNVIPNMGISSHCVDPYIIASSILYAVETFEVHFDLDDKLGIESGHSYTSKTLPTLIKHATLLKQAMKYNGLDDLDRFARNNYRRDSSDWLRPVIKG